MGLIRGWLLVIVSILLLISLIATGSFLTLSSSLAYDSVKTDLAPVVSEMLNLNDSFEGYETLLNYCTGNENVSYRSQILGTIIIPCDILEQGVEPTVNYFLIEPALSKESNVNSFRKDLNLNYVNLSDFCKPHDSFFINSDDGGINISCESVLIGPEAVVEEQVQNQIDSIYYKEYTCSFFDCIKDNPLSLVSEKTYNYFWSKFISLIIVSLILFGVLFLLVEVKSNAFILAGILVFFSGLPLLLLDKILGWIVGVEFLRIFSFLFNEAKSVFFKLVIFAVIFVIIGFIWKSFALGFKINSFFEKFRKPKVIIKEVEKKK